MIESELAKQWATMPDFPNRIASWTWFKSSVSECLMNTAHRLNFQCELHNGDLAYAFFGWAGYVDNTQNFSKLEPVDYAHYACGLLLMSLIQAHPITVVNKNASASIAEKSLLELLDWPEDLVVLCVTLTFLESWRLHLGAAPLHINQELIKSHWNSFHENAKEDKFSPVGFLDLFLGLSPVWGRTVSPSSRPAMVLASELHHSDHSQGA